MCCGIENPPSGISLDAKSTLDRRRNRPDDYGTNQGDEGGHTIYEGSVSDNAAGSRGVVRGLREVVTCIYGPTVTYAFPDPLITAYRESLMVYVSLISVLHGTAQNWCKQEHLWTQMSDTLLFGRVKDLELIVLNFRGQLQCRMGGKRERPIKSYPKFWILNPLEKHTREIVIIRSWTEAFDLIRKELEMILEKELLTAIIPELPTVRRMTMTMNSPMLVPSAQAREVVKRQQRAFTQGWDPCLSDTLQLHTSTRMNSR